MMTDLLGILTLILKILGLEEATKKSIILLDPFSNMLGSVTSFGSTTLAGLYYTYFSTYAFLMAVGLTLLTFRLLLNPNMIASQERGLGLSMGVSGAGNMFPGAKGYAIDHMFSGLNGVLPNYGGTILEWLLNALIKPLIYLTIAFVLSTFATYMLKDIMLTEVTVAFVENPLISLNFLFMITPWYLGWLMVHMILVVLGLFCIPLIEVGSMYNSSITRAIGRVFDVNLLVPFLMALLYTCGLMLWNSEGFLKPFIGLGLSFCGSLVPIVLILGASLIGLIEIAAYLVMFLLAKLGIPVGPLAKISQQGLPRVLGATVMSKVTRSDGKKRPTQMSNKSQGGGI